MNSQIKIQTKTSLIKISPSHIPLQQAPLRVRLSVSSGRHTHTLFFFLMCSEIHYLSRSLCQNRPGGHHGDVCFLETSREDPHVRRLHQHAETARCVNTRSLYTGENNTSNYTEELLTAFVRVSKCFQWVRLQPNTKQNFSDPSSDD